MDCLSVYTFRYSILKRTPILFISRLGDLLCFNYHSESVVGYFMLSRVVNIHPCADEHRRAISGVIINPDRHMAHDITP